MAIWPPPRPRSARAASVPVAAVRCVGGYPAESQRALTRPSRCRLTRRFPTVGQPLRLRGELGVSIPHPASGPGPSPSAFKRLTSPRRAPCAQPPGLSPAPLALCPSVLEGGAEQTQRVWVPLAKLGAGFGRLPGEGWSGCRGACRRARARSACAVRLGGEHATAAPPFRTRRCGADER
jgi:hypothetical protein